MKNPTNALDTQLLELCRQDKKLAAVKLYMEKTGFGLKVSKDYVDELYESDEAGSAGSTKFIADTTLDNQLMEYCLQNRKLEAIKLYKETTGKGLKESKDYVDELCRRHGIEKASESGDAKPGKCFIATACYGDYDAPEVLVLRNFRDQKLLTTYAGTVFVKLYYTVSPVFAQQIEKSRTLKHVVRTKFLQPLIWAIERYNSTTTGTKM